MDQSHVINSAALDASVTSFRTAFDEFFVNRGDDPLISAFTEDISADGGSRAQVIFEDTIGNWREFIGGREVVVVRPNVLNVTMKTYERTMMIRRIDMRYDKIGVVERRIRRFLSAAASYKIELFHEMLFSNSGAGTTGYDGVAWFSTAHPNGPSGATQSNLSTAVLSRTAFNAAYSQMASLGREGGLPYYVLPTTLVVGPNNRTNGLEITSADLRSQGMTAGGVTDAAAAVLASAAISNVNAGVVNLIVDPYLTGTRATWWYLLGAPVNAGQVKPALYLEGMAPTEQLDVSMDSPSVIATDRFTYGLIADGSFAPGAWQTAIWSNGTT